MKLFYFIFLSTYFFSASVDAKVVVQDDAGYVLSFTKPIERIISLSPHITELLFAAGGGQHVVGVTKYSDYPEEAKRLPVVGDSYQLDIERIIQLKPDLIVVWGQGGSVKQLNLLRQLSIPLFYSDAHTLDDIPKSIALFGRLMGTEKEATQSADYLRGQLSILTTTYAHLPPVRVFYQVWEKPLFTVNGQQIISDAMKVCGGVNMFKTQKVAAPSVSVEAVLQGNPDAIVATSDGLTMWKRYPSLFAVKHNNLFVLDDNLISRPGPRMIEGTAALCEKLNQARKML